MYPKINLESAREIKSHTCHSFQSRMSFACFISNQILLNCSGLQSLSSLRQKKSLTVMYSKVNSLRVSWERVSDLQQKKEVVLRIPWDALSCYITIAGNKERNQEVISRGNQNPALTGIYSLT